MTNECRCGQPTRDNAYVCDNCGDNLARSLGDIPWLIDELNTTITRQRAAPTEGSGRTFDKPLPWHEKAADTLRTLHGLLVSWARFCEEENIRNSSPRIRPLDEHDDHPGALSGWLLWRVDGLTLHDIGPEAVDEITDAVAACHRIIDRRPDRLYLGACECGAQMFTNVGKRTHKCRQCEAEWDVQGTREALAELAMETYQGKLFTASEAAQVLCAIGQAPDTDPVRLADSIRKWATPRTKGASPRLIARGSVKRADQRRRPGYRLDEITDLLAHRNMRSTRLGA